MASGVCYVFIIYFGDIILVPVRVDDRPKYSNACINSLSCINDHVELIAIRGYNVQPTPIPTSIVHDIGFIKIDALITFY